VPWYSCPWELRPRAGLEGAAACDSALDFQTTTLPEGGRPAALRFPPKPPNRRPPFLGDDRPLLGTSLIDHAASEQPESLVIDTFAWARRSVLATRRLANAHESINSPRRGEGPPPVDPGATQ